MTTTQNSATASESAATMQMNHPSFWTWFDGGYNMPSEKEIENAPGWEETLKKEESEKNPKTLSLLTWILSGAFNLPSEEKIKDAPNTVIEKPPPSGICAWLNGGYNIPKLVKKEHTAASTTQKMD